MATAMTFLFKLTLTFPTLKIEECMSKYRRRVVFKIKIKIPTKLRVMI